MDDQVSTLDVFRLLLQGDGDAHFPHHLEGVSLVIVGAGEVVTFGVEDLGQWKHSGASDADEVNVAFVFEIHGRSSFPLSSSRLCSDQIRP